MDYKYSIRTRDTRDCIKALKDFGDQKFVDWQPGNGTRYALLFVRLDPQVQIEESGDWQVTWLTKLRTMFIGQNSFVHYNYVKEKMHCGSADAICIAEAIGHVLGFNSTTSEQFDPELPVRLIMDS